MCPREQTTTNGLNSKNFHALWMAFSKSGSLTTSTPHWRTNIGGKEKDFDAEITQQIPDKRIAWRSRSGAPNAGVVTFHPLNDQNARIMLQMEYEPEGIIEKGGDILGVASRRIEGDLKRFKEYVESKGRERGAWRGTIDRPA